MATAVFHGSAVQAGGAGQPTLQFTGDIVKAGYNINMNRPITAAGPIPPASATRLSEVWNTPSGCPRLGRGCGGREHRHHLRYLPQGQHSGTGLLPKLHQEATTVTVDLQNLVGGCDTPTLANLDKITAPVLPLPGR